MWIVMKTDSSLPYTAAERARDRERLVRMLERELIRRRAAPRTSAMLRAREQREIDAAKASIRRMLGERED